MIAYAALVFVGLVAAALFVPRLPRVGAAVVSPARPAAGETTAPVVHGVTIERKPYDHGCLAVEISDEEMIT